MTRHWYIYLIIAALSCLLYWAFDTLHIIKSKSLRVLIVILIASIITWLIYDLVIAPK